MRERWSEFSESIEKSREYHKRYQIAVNSPMRRKILKMIRDGKTLDQIKEETGLDDKNLEYHLEILEWGFCIERDGDKIHITKEGEVIDHIQ